MMFLNSGGQAPYFLSSHRHLVCISDIQMTHPGFSLPDGDVLIHAGDATSEGFAGEVVHF